MSDEYSYYYGAPRSEIHEALYGTTAVPPRQGRIYGGAGGASASNGSTILILLGLGLLLMFLKKR